MSTKYFTLKKEQKINIKFLYIGIALVFLVLSALTSILSHLPDPNKKDPLKKMEKITTDSVESVEIALIDDRDVNKILERNIFNSEGKLGDWEPSSEIVEDHVVTSEIIESKLPLKLKGVIYTSDPYSGLAYVSNSNSKSVESFLSGDIIFQLAELYQILEDRIIIDNKGQKEYVLKEKYEIVRSSRNKKPKSRGKKDTSTKIATTPPPETFREDGLERVGLSISLTDSYLQNIMGDLPKILQDAKAEPNMVNGELKGFELTRIRENSIYEKAGFQNGDIIKEINGYPLNDPAGAIRLLQQLRNAKEVDVVLDRNGQSKDMSIKIQ